MVNTAPSRARVAVGVAIAGTLIGAWAPASAAAQPLLPGLDSGSGLGGDQTNYTVSAVLHVTNNSGYDMTLASDTTAVYGKFDPAPASSVPNGGTTTIYYYSNNFWGGDFRVGYTVNDSTTETDPNGVICQHTPYTIVGEYKIPLAGSNSATTTGGTGIRGQIHATITIDTGYHPNAEYLISPNDNVDCY